MITMVPERATEKTTERGFKLETEGSTIESLVDRFQKAGVAVSIFIDPSEDNVRLAADIGADFVELNTNYYAESESFEQEIEELDRLDRMANLSAKLKLGVAVGHALDYRNIANIATIEAIEEYSIGHSIICRAVYVGLQKAVEEMKELISKYQKK